MNRRIATFYYWLTRKNSVGIVDLIKFLCSPRSRNIAAHYIERIEDKGMDLQVWLKGVEDCLFWPKEFELSLLYQMVAETCDKNNWHNYFHPQFAVSAEDVVVDVGAAEGLFSLLALQLGAKVIAVEPNLVFAASLQRTLQRYIPERASICQIAAGDTDALVSLSLEPLISAVELTGESREGNVRMLPLDRLLADFDKVTFIKADIEGGEMRMLKGASNIIRRFHPQLVITCYHEANDYREMIRFVQGLVPEYRYVLRGITHFHGKPLLIRFWVPEKTEA